MEDFGLGEKDNKYKRVVGTSRKKDIFTWVNAAYSVHTDTRDQTGVAMLMGWNVINEKSGNQTLNTKS